MKNKKLQRVLKNCMYFTTANSVKNTHKKIYLKNSGNKFQEIVTSTPEHFCHLKMQYIPENINCAKGCVKFSPPEINIINSATTHNKNLFY